MHDGRCGTCTWWGIDPDKVGNPPIEHAFNVDGYKECRVVRDSWALGGIGEPQIGPDLIPATFGCVEWEAKA